MELERDLREDGQMGGRDYLIARRASEGTGFWWILGKEMVSSGRRLKITSWGMSSSILGDVSWFFVERFEDGELLETVYSIRESCDFGVLIKGRRSPRSWRFLL